MAPPRPASSCARNGSQRPDPSRPLAVGRPLANTRISIRRENGDPVPPGVVGEVWLGGVGLARGYLNNPDLTGGNSSRRRMGDFIDRETWAAGPKTAAWNSQDASTTRSNCTDSALSWARSNRRCFPTLLWRRQLRWWRRPRTAPRFWAFVRLRRYRYADGGRVA